MATPAGAVAGSYWVEGAEWHYITSAGVEYASTGTAVSTPSGATPGSYWVEGENWAYVDASGVKRTLVKTSLGPNTQPAGSYWVESSAAAGKQWQWLSGTTRYEHWNGSA